MAEFLILLFVKESWSDGTAYKVKQVRKKDTSYIHTLSSERNPQRLLLRKVQDFAMHLYHILKIILSLAVEMLLPLTNEVSC